MKRKSMLAGLMLCLFFMSSCKTQYADHPHVEYVTEPCLVPVSPGVFKLCDSMIVRVDNKFHVVPRGFQTDLASIPRAMWPIASPNDYDSIAPSVLHDWHYCCSKDVSRKEADEIFYHGLRAQGMCKTKAYIYYLSVRSLGSHYFKNGEDAIAHAGQFDKNEIQGVYNDDTAGLDEIP